MGAPEGWEPPKGGGSRRVGPPKGGGPKISRFFPSPVILSSSLGGRFVEFWWCDLKTGDVKCARLEFSCSATSRADGANSPPTSRTLQPSRKRSLAVSPCFWEEAPLLPVPLRVAAGLLSFYRFFVCEQVNDHCTVIFASSSLICVKNSFKGLLFVFEQTQRYSVCNVGPRCPDSGISDMFPQQVRNCILRTYMTATGTNAHVNFCRCTVVMVCVVLVNGKFS